MKKITTVILSAAVSAALLLTGAAVSGGTEYASAEGGETFYPEFVSELDLGAIDGYAVGEDSFAFSQGARLYIYEGGTSSLVSDGEGNPIYLYEGGIMDSADGVLCAYEHTSAIVNMCYSASGDGGYLFEDARGGVYLYSEGGITPSSLEVPAHESRVFYGDILMYLTDGTLTCVDISSTNPQTAVPEGSFEALSVTDDGVYALRDGSLCLIEGNSVSELTISSFAFNYIDISHENTIAVGNTAELLGQLNETPQFVSIPAGQNITEIDLSDLTGAYFATVAGESGYATTTLESAANALVLCTTGNADIIAIGGKTYITLASAVKVASVATAAPFENATLIYSSSIYSAPYMSDATELAVLDTGAVVSVSGQIEISAQPLGGEALTADFCKVSYTADDGTVTEGYVATALLTVYNFSGEDGEFGEPTLPDDYSEEDVILTVVLVIVIVVLVIAGVAYLSYVSGANKRKKKESKNKGRDDSDDENNYS